MLKIYTLFTITLFICMACMPAKKNKLVSVEPQCLKSQSQCIVETKFGKVSVLFNKGKVFTEEPFNIYLMLEDINVREQSLVQNKKAKLTYKISKINSYMEGKEMFMGKIPVMFSPSGQDNMLATEALLGSCSQKQMVWRLWLTVLFEINNQSTTDNAVKESYPNDINQETFFIDFTSNRF